MLLGVVSLSLAIAVPLACQQSVPARAPAFDPPLPPPTRVLDVRSFGAVGDGVTDDTRSLRTALAFLRPGDQLVIPAGRTFRHTDLLELDVPRVHLTGGGALLATDEVRSAVWINADDVLVDGGLTFRMGHTSRRWSAYEQAKLRLMGHRGDTLRNINVDGSAAAGILVGSGASDFLLDNVTVRNTRADGIHMTGGAHDGHVNHPVVSGAGDDSVAVVSYSRDASPCYGLTIDSPISSANVGGRAFSVVGGHDISYRNVTATASSSAAVYIATEGAPYYTRSTQRITVSGGTLTGSNTDAGVDHGAVVVYAGNESTFVDSVKISDLTIRDTRPTARFTTSVRQDAGASMHGILLRDITILGAAPTAFGASPSISADSYQGIGFRVNGRAIPNHD